MSRNGKVHQRQYHKPIFRRVQLTVDKNNVVYLENIRIARYIPERRVLEFCDQRRSRSQPQRVVEVAIADLAGELLAIGG